MSRSPDDSSSLTYMCAFYCMRAGYGKTHDKMAQWLRSRDPSRPIM